MNEEPLHKILFVCMGNICRSPSAEGILLKKVQERGLENNFLIDSCGTHGYHEGQSPDQRSIEAALLRGIDIRNQISRLVVNSDFEYFDYIISMDHHNVDTLKQISDSKYHHKLSLFLDYTDSSKYIEVPDPYYGGDHGFELVLDLLDRAAEGLIRHLVETS